MRSQSETQEWLGELVESWTEVYKKSMTTVVLLRIIGELGPVGVDAVAPKFTDVTKWHITERGLYRTLRRLTNSGLLNTTEEPAAKTGAMRKLFRLTPLGSDYLRAVESKMVAVQGPSDQRGVG